VGVRERERNGREIGKEGKEVKRERVVEWWIHRYGDTK